MSSEHIDLTQAEVESLRDLVECEEVYGGFYSFNSGLRRLEAKGLICRPHHDDETIITDKGRAVVEAMERGSQ